MGIQVSTGSAVGWLRYVGFCSLLARCLLVCRGPMLTASWHMRGFGWIVAYVGHVRLHGCSSTPAACMVTRTGFR
jgi:hypothetical protein